MSNLKKKISLFCILTFIISFFATTVNASIASDRQSFWNNGYKTIDTTVGIAANVENANSHNYPFNLHEYETYCIQHNSGFKTARYRVNYYIELDGAIANRFDKTGKVLKTCTNKQENGTLEYLLEEESYKKSGRINKNESLNNFEKEHVKDLDNSCMSIRNLALWRYMKTWMNQVGVNKLGISSKWVYNYETDASDEWNKEADSFVERAKAAARTAVDPSVTSTYKKASNVQEDKSIIGPFKFNCTGTGLNISVYNMSDKKINNVEFYSDRKCTKTIAIKDIKLGKEFYIKNNSSDQIKNVKVSATGTKIKAQLWFLSYDEIFTKDSGQAIMIARSSKEKAESPAITIPVESTTGDLKIIKTDAETGKKLAGVKFKIHCGLGWIQETLDANGNYTYKADKDNGLETANIFTTDENGEILVKNLLVLKNGYNVYEVGPLPKGYYLEDQEDKQKGYIYNRQREYVFIKETLYIKPNQTTPLELKLTNNEYKTGSLKIIKTDVDTGEKLEGVKFKIYSVEKGWIQKDLDPKTGKYTFLPDSDKAVENAREFTTDENGEALIENLPVLDKGYIVYESGLKEGYVLKQQENSEKGYEYIADRDYVKINEIVYIKENQTSPVELEITNDKKRVDKLEGFVWVDEPDTKANVTDNIYKKGKDTLKEGITVHLRNMSDNKDLANPVTTDKNGHYEFNNLNLTYSDIEKAYVEFEYDNNMYTLVDLLAGNDDTINSKAKERELTAEKLNDELIKNKDSKAYPGNAITELKEGTLTKYYDRPTYTVSNINLGLLEKIDPEYTVSETLQYVKVKMKGYTYTYKYGDAVATNSPYTPTVNAQTGAKTFSAAIYPTDIAYNMAENTDELKVYVVYSIGVKNTQTLNIDNQYVEQNLYLNSLTNTFDDNRYQLCNNENNADSSDFALWQANGNVASYDVNNGVYKDGIKPLETKTSLIQFRIKDEALRKIMQKQLTEKDIENAPTVATANGYHEYLRTDNVWNDNQLTAFNGVKGKGYPTVSSNNKKYYVHKSVSKDAKSSDLYIRLSLAEQRKLSGTVFEDTITEESINENTSLGNGILDDGEENKAKNVKVELLNADKSTVSKLYKVENRAIVYNQDGTLPNAEARTLDDGTFTFDGVVPGYYYIRFTYSDGTQKMMPANDVISSKDYRSTIINTADNNSIIKNAMEAESKTLQDAQQTLVNDYSNESAKKIVEWYKYLGDKKYSTAVDDTNQRLKVDGYEYRNDGKVYDKGGKEVQDGGIINSYTPMIGISIEDDVNNQTAGNVGTEHKSIYNEFNFGIIKQAPTVTTLDKKITNVKFTNQVGTTLVSANPIDITANYVTALDNIAGGSKYAKLETAPENIYGSNIEITYKIAIENKTNKDYIEDENSKEFGYYYKYGIITEGNSELKKVTVGEVQDYIDPKYNLNSLPKTVKQTKSDSKEITLEPVTTTSIDDDGAELKTTYIKMTGWESLASSEETSIEYTVTSLIAKEDDTEYSNDAKITSLSIDKLTTLESGSEWGADSTIFAITPSTGANRSYTELIVGIIALIVAATGFVAIKKKVL